MSTRAAHIDAPSLSAAARVALDTPALVIDLDRMDAAIAGWPRRCASAGSPSAARQDAQIAWRSRGARSRPAQRPDGRDDRRGRGLRGGGFDDLFIAYPLVPLGPKAARLRALADRSRLRLGVDSEAASGLSPTRSERSVPGSGWSSRSTRVGAGAASRRAGPARWAGRRSSWGWMCSASSRMAATGTRVPRPESAAADDEVRTLTEAAASLRRAGIEPSVVSAGSTPTAVDSAGVRSPRSGPAPTCSATASR